MLQLHGHAARGHAQAAGRGPRGAPAAGHRTTPAWDDLPGNCRSGWAEPDRGVLNICHRFAAEGAKGLVSKPRGRKPGEQCLLTPAQEAEVQELIRRRTPDELGLPFALWSRAAVRALIACRCGVELAVRTVGKYLARWGFTAQKPIRRAYEQDPAAVRRWLRREYPAIVARARQARGVIFWGDETGLRSDDVRGRGYAPRGRTPVVRVCHRRASLSLISAVSNRGALRWMVLDGAVNAAALIRFLQRLIRDVRRKVFLILDRLQVHRAGQIRDWLAAHRTKIEVFYLRRGLLPACLQSGTEPG